MAFGGKKATILLFAGDIALFVFSLWLTLFIRYAALPGGALFLNHVQAFAFLFVLWPLVFYMAGLYSKRAVLFKSELSAAILRTQLLNIVLAALFFFFVPSFGIAPKTNLAIYLVVSLLAIFIWRLGIFPRITEPSSRERAALIGSGPEVEELVSEVNTHARYYLEFLVIASPQEVAKNIEAFEKKLAHQSISLLIFDEESDSLRPVLPRLYELAFLLRRYQIANLHEVYEDMFDRVPLSLLQYDWFLKNISHPALGFYAGLKRAIDLVGGIVMGAVTVVLIPLVFLALRLESPGPLFIPQERLGQYGSRMRAYKFRSMRFNDMSADKWLGEGKNYVTRVGRLLRRTSLDEFPQFVNILRGELSLVGPRNDIEGLGSRLSEAIAYYNIRYVVKPGITGWAQINQQYEPGNISPQSIEETKRRLAYDFYYIKNRSLALDIVIALRTIKRMFFRVSSW